MSRDRSPKGRARTALSAAGCALLSVALGGCASCSGDESFAAAARGDLRGVHELGELGDPLVPPPQSSSLRKISDALAALKPHLAHENPFHRLVALESVRRLAQRAKSVVRSRYPDLLDPLLRDPDPELRWRAAWTLGRLELTRPELRSATRDPDLRVAERALWALGEARDAEALGELVAALDRPEPLPAAAAAALRRTTGLKLASPEAWKEWSAKR